MSPFQNRPSRQDIRLLSSLRRTFHDSFSPWAWIGHRDECTPIRASIHPTYEYRRNRDEVHHTTNYRHRQIDKYPDYARHQLVRGHRDEVRQSRRFSILLVFDSIRSFRDSNTRSDRKSNRISLPSLLASLCRPTGAFSRRSRPRRVPIEMTDRWTTFFSTVNGRRRDES